MTGSNCRICLGGIEYIGGMVVNASDGAPHGCEKQPDEPSTYFTADLTLWGEPAVQFVEEDPPIEVDEPARSDAAIEPIEELPESVPTPKPKIAAQASMFELEDFAEYKKHWKGMPEFVQKDLGPVRSLLVHFAESEDVRAFARLVGQEISGKTRSLWYPKAEITQLVTKRYADDEAEIEAIELAELESGDES